MHQPRVKESAPGKDPEKDRRKGHLKFKEEKLCRRKWTSVTKTRERTKKKKKKTGGSLEQGNLALNANTGQSVVWRLEG